MAEEDEMLTITADKPKTIKASLVDEIYSIRPIKGSLALSLSGQLKGAEKKQDPEELNKMVGKIIDMMFEKDDRPKIRKRLSDPDDGLDFMHIMELMGKLMERATGNPTTSPSDS